MERESWVDWIKKKKIIDGTLVKKVGAEAFNLLEIQKLST